MTQTDPIDDDRRAAVLRARRLVRGGSPDQRFVAMVRTVPRPADGTLAWAQAQLIERYVAKWGEQERAASIRRVQSEAATVGLALNRLAYWDVDHPDDYLAAQAVVMMTDADVRSLRAGG